MPQTLEQPAPVEQGFPAAQRHRLRRVLCRQRASRRRTTTAPRSACSWRPIAGPETGVRDRASYVADAEQDPLRADHAARPDHPIAEHVRLHGDGVHDIALWVDDAEVGVARDHARAARAACASPRSLRDDHGEVRICRPSPPTATPSTPSSSGATTSGAFLPGFRAVEPKMPLVAARRAAAHRSHGGQRRLGRDGPLGGFLSRRDGLPHVPALRRQGHQHGVLGADVEGDVERQRARQVPHQRAGRRASASRRSRNIWSSTTAPACSTSPWPPTTSSRPSARCGARASSFCACRPLTTRS